MRISDWSSDVCSSDLAPIGRGGSTSGEVAVRPNLSKRSALLFSWRKEGRCLDRLSTNGSGYRVHAPKVRCHQPPRRGSPSSAPASSVVASLAATSADAASLLAAGGAVSAATASLAAAGSAFLSSEERRVGQGGVSAC